MDETERKVIAIIIIIAIVVSVFIILVFVVPRPLQEWFEKHGFNRVKPIEYEETEWYFTKSGMLWNLDRPNYVYSNDELAYQILFDTKLPYAIEIEAEFQIFVGDKNVTNKEKLDYKLNLSPEHKTDGISYSFFAHEGIRNVVKTDLRIINSTNQVLLGDKTEIVKFDVHSPSIKLQDDSNRTTFLAFVASLFIGSATVIVLVFNVFSSKKQVKGLQDQNKHLEDQNKLLKEQTEKQNEISKKQIHYLALFEIMKFFNDPRIAKERDIIYNAYRNKSLYSEDGEFQGQDLAGFAASVRGTFDQMGKLVKDEFIPKEQFLDMYAGAVIMMYKVLQKHIENEREKRKTRQFANYFEWIFNEAKDYWKKKFPDEQEPVPY